jgi:hypothetical protein
MGQTGGGGGGVSSDAEGAEIQGRQEEGVRRNLLEVESLA